MCVAIASKALLSMCILSPWWPWFHSSAMPEGGFRFRCAPLATAKFDLFMKFNMAHGWARAPCLSRLTHSEARPLCSMLIATGLGHARASTGICVCPPTCVLGP
eukprot:4064124-Alexandrium_andersonii.AAC.1